MRITNSMCENIVNDVMSDVPKVDYVAQIESLIVDSGVASLPPAIKKIWGDLKLRQYVATDTTWVRGACRSVAHPGEISMSGDLKKQIESLVDKDKEQDESRSELRAKLYGILSTCNTLKQLHERLPEFEKYFPVEVVGTKNLPATNVVADLVKAGWTITIKDKRS